MSSEETETRRSTVDLDALESWLDGLPKAAERRQQAHWVERAADQLEVLQERLETVARRLHAVQAGLAILAQPSLGGSAVLDNLLEGLDQLPKGDMRALASFAQGQGRTLPNQAERFSAEVESQWRGLCDKFGRDTTKPLDALLGAIPDKAKQGAIRLIISNINAAKKKMIDAPEASDQFLKAQKKAQDYLAHTLSGASNPGGLVEQLAEGRLRLRALSETDLEALLRSPLADAITLKL